MKLDDAARAFFRKTGKRGAKTTHSRYTPAQRSAQIKRGLKRKQEGKG